jgi:hypothetical protein
MVDRLIYLQMQSVIITKVVSSIPAHDKVYL